MLTNELLTMAYETLKQTASVAFEANEAVLVAKRDLEEGRAGLIAQGLIDGKNEAQREAQFRQHLAGQYETLNLAEANARQARHALELARLDVELARAQLRLMELAEAGAA